MQITESGEFLEIAPVYEGSDPGFMLVLGAPSWLGQLSIGPDGNSLIYSPNGAFENLAAGQSVFDTVLVDVVADGVTVSHSFDVEIVGENDAPVEVSPPTLADGFEDTLYQFTTADLLGGVSDVDDGAVLTVANLTATAGSLSFDASTDLYTLLMPQDFNGPVEFSYDVTDGQGGVVNRQRTIVISPLNDAPTAPAGASIVVEEDGTSGPVAIDAADIDGDALSYSLAPGFEPVLGAVSFDAVAGTFTYTPYSNVHGSDGFTILIEDGEGATTTQEVVVTLSAANDAPQALDDTDDISLRAGEALSVTLDPALFTDIDLDPLSYQVRLEGGAPLPEWLNFDSGTYALTGTPPVGEEGVYALAFVASDGSAEAEIAFSLEVRERSDVRLAIGEDTAPFFLDPEYFGGDPEAVITLDASGATGEVKLFADGAISYTAQERFDALRPGQSVTDSFIVHVTSGGVTTDWTYQFTIDGVNDAPVAQAAIPTHYAAAGSSFSFTIPEDLFFDAEGDALTYAAFQGFDGALPEWISFDPLTRTYSGIAPEISSGEALTIDLKIQARDGSATGGARFDFVVSRSPFITNAPDDYLGLEDQPVFIQLPLDMFATLPGETLNYTVTRGNGDPLESWLTFDAQSLTLTGQPPADFVGGFNVLVTASDSSGSSSVKFALKLENVPDAPTGLDLSTPWVTELSEPGALVAVLTARDPDVGDHFAYSLLDDAGGAFAIRDNILVVDGYLNARDGNGIKTITVVATDATGNSTQASFDIEVRKASAGELFSGLTPTTQMWVATDGSDETGDGSADHPFATIQHAIDLATPGTAVMVKAGTYQEALTIRTSGDPDAPIWLLSADGVGAAEIKPVGAAEVNAINGQAVQNFVIEGFAITGTDTIGTYGINIVSRNNGADASFEEGFGGTLSANMLIKNNIITGWGIDGIHLAYAFNTQIVGNTVSGAHEQGIDIVYGAKLLIANNHVDNITRMPAWFGLDQRDYIGDSAITVKAGSVDVEILNNYIGTTGGYGIKVGAPSGLRGVPIEWGLDSDGAHYVSYEARNVLVQGNVVLNSANGAIDLNSAIDVTVRENLLSALRISGYERTVASVTYGGAEPFLPLGLRLYSEDLSLVDNLYTAAVFRNSGQNAHISETGNVVYDPGASYSAQDYAWVIGQQADWTTTLHEIFGTSKANSISGTDGADYLDGKLGDDTLAGGMGDDVYVFDTRGDLAVEAAGQGIDTLILTRTANRIDMNVSAANVENAIAAWTGNFSIIGNALDNVLRGGNGNDQIRGESGSDTLHGGAGEDLLNGGVGRDFLYGGAGNDQLVGGNDDDVIEGGAGRDKLLGGAGDDMLISYDSDDRIWGGVGVDTVYLDRSTFSASQRIVLDISYFGDGTAPLEDPRQIIMIDGTRVQNVEKVAISAGAADDEIIGGYFTDQISGGAGDDYLDGFMGDDLIWGAAGQDRIFGGEGNDRIDGGQDADLVEGGGGDDIIVSQEPDIALHGGSGIDTLEINRDGTAETYIFDGAAMELSPDAEVTLADGTIISGFETFLFTAGDGDDLLIGGSRNDRLHGSQGNDTLFGGAGNDRLNGGSGVDYIYGGTGGDTINGGGLADHLWGEGGTDIFTYIPGQANGDVIHDFSGAGIAGGDTLRFTGFGVGATLSYNSDTQLWTAASADNSISESFTIVGVTYLSGSDYSLL